jgi:hypothetical protein
MPDTGIDNLFVVALVALLAPLVVAALPALRVPALVLEILAGIVLGPDVLGAVEADVPVQVLAVIGLAFLLFTVGLELDVRTLRGTALRFRGRGESRHPSPTAGVTRRPPTGIRLPTPWPVARAEKDPPRPSRAGGGRAP